MKHLRSAFLALVLMAGFSPAFAQAPAAVPTLPDTERRVSYALTASTCACSIPFAIFGEGVDYANWIEVWVNGTRIDQFGNWTISSPSGSINTLPRPITNGVLTFNVAQTGTVQIVGARRPRRISQFSESTGVSARNLNQVFTDIIAQNRETWDKINDVTGRVIMAQPGESLGVLASAASRANSVLGFDALGNIKTYSPASGVTGADSVNFLQAGTGAVSRTVQAELRDTVKAAQFGAVCDGVTDDAPAVQRAINYADTIGNPTVELCAGTTRWNTTPFLNKWTTPGILSVPGLSITGANKSTTIIDTRVANGYAIAVNPEWKSAFQALAGGTTPTIGGSLGTTTYYVQITVNDPLGNEIFVTLPKSFSVTGPTGRIGLTLPAVNTGYTYNIYVGTATQPANYATISGVNGTLVGGGQTVYIDAIGSAHAVPVTKIATNQQVNISDLTITSTTAPANASGILLFKAAYSNVTRIHVQSLLGDGLVIPNYVGDADGSFVVTVDKSKFDNIAGWCVDAAGLALELSNLTISNTHFNLCGTLPSVLNVNRTILSITNAATNVVTTTAGHGWLPNDQVYLSGVSGMALAAGWYRVGATPSPTTFNLWTLDGVVVDTTSLGAYTPSSGTGKLSWRPPTTTTGSGGIRWMGLIGTFKSLGFTQVYNTSMYFTEGGASDNATLENIDFENTYGKGLYAAALVGGKLINSECLSATVFGPTISCVQLGTGFAGGGVSNFQIENMKVRSDVTPANGFEQFKNTNNTGAFVNSTRVSGVSWQQFNSANQRFVGFNFGGITGNARFSITGVNTATLIPIGYGATLPMKLAATGEWIEYHVPAAGITATVGPLSNNTQYYFYLRNSAAASAPEFGVLDFSLGGFVLDAEGYYVKASDSTWTYVGTATTDGSGNFQTTSAQSSQYPVGGGSSVGVGAANQVAYFSAASTINGLAACNSGAIVTSAGGVPSCATTLPNMAHGTPTSITLTNGTGLPISTGVSGLAAGAATALSTTLGTPGSFVGNSGALGTPSSGVGTNLTALNATNLASGTVAAARGGAGTITGALKGNGAGVVSQAACADLSNGAAGCSQANAAKTDMETPTSSVLNVTPARTQNHPGVAKFFMRADGKTGATCTIPSGGSYNVASCSRTGTGAYTVNFTTSFANANYEFSGGCYQVGVAPGIATPNSLAGFATGSISFFCMNTATQAAMDADIISVTGYGLQ